MGNVILTFTRDQWCLLYASIYHVCKTTDFQGDNKLSIPCVTYHKNE